jgi:hypothetical protein
MPALVAEYAATSSRALVAAVEAVLTIAPRVFFKWGIAYFVPMKADFRLTAKTLSQSAALKSSRRCTSDKPALLCSTSSLPSFSTAVAIIAATSGSSPTSARIANALPPASSMDLTVEAAASSERSTHATLAPSRANVAAHSRPIPEPAPVTMAALPGRRNSYKRPDRRST